MMSSGSAPISSEVVDFMRIAFSCEFIEGMPLICHTHRWND